MKKKRVKVYSDIGFEEYLAALTREKKRLKRELTEEEMKKIAIEVKESQEHGENKSNISNIYNNR